MGTKSGMFRMVSKRADRPRICVHLDCEIPVGEWHWYDSLLPNEESWAGVLCSECFEMLVGRGQIHVDDIVEA